MITFRAQGPRPVDDVWTALVDPARWPQWAPQLRGTEGLPSPLSPGAEGHVIGPAGVRVPVRITAVEPELRRWSWLVLLGPWHLPMDHLVEPAAGGSRVRVVLHGPKALLAPYGPVATWALRRLVRVA